MRHFTLAQWADQARGVAPPEVSAAMRVHLSGCGPCSQLFSAMSRAARAAEADRSFEPPAAAVSLAEQIFPPARRVVRGAWAGLSRLAGELSWDSLSDAAPEGVRSARPDSRHLLYRAGAYSVDLVMENDPGSRTVTLSGQIADESLPDSPVARPGAVLLSGNKVIASTYGNEFGEFALHYSPGSNLRLRLPLEQSGKFVELPLPLQ